MNQENNSSLILDENKPRLDSKAELRAAMADLLANQKQLQLLRQGETKKSRKSDSTKQEQLIVNNNSNIGASTPISSTSSSSSSRDSSRSSSVSTAVHAAKLNVQNETKYLHSTMEQSNNSETPPSIRYHKQSKDEEDELLSRLARLKQRNYQSDVTTPTKNNDRDVSHLNQSRRNSFHQVAENSPLHDPYPHRHAKVTPEVFMNIRMGNQFTLGPPISSPSGSNSSQHHHPIRDPIHPSESSYRKGILNAQSVLRDIKLQAQKNFYQTEQVTLIQNSEREQRKILENQQEKSFAEEISSKFIFGLLEYLENVLEPLLRRNIEKEFSEVMFGSEDDSPGCDCLSLFAQFKAKQKFIQIGEAIKKFRSHVLFDFVTDLYRQESQAWAELIDDFFREQFLVSTSCLFAKETNCRCAIEEESSSILNLEIRQEFSNSHFTLVNSSRLFGECLFEFNLAIENEEKLDRQRILFRMQREFLEEEESELRNSIYSFVKVPEYHRGEDLAMNVDEFSPKRRSGKLNQQENNNNNNNASSDFDEECQVGRAYRILRHQNQESISDANFSALSRSEQEERENIWIEIGEIGFDREIIREWNIQTLTLLRAMQERERFEFIRNGVDAFQNKIFSCSFFVFNFSDLLFCLESFARSKLVMEVEILERREKIFFLHQRCLLEIQEEETRSQIESARNQEFEPSSSSCFYFSFQNSFFEAQQQELLRRERERREETETSILDDEFTSFFSKINLEWNQDIDEMRKKLFRESFDLLIQEESQERLAIHSEEKNESETTIFTQEFQDELDEMNKKFKREIYFRELEVKAKCQARPFVGFSLVEKGSAESFSRRRKVFEPLIVDSMYVDGPALRAGIQLGDVLVSVAGKESTSLVQVRTQLARNGTVGSRIAFTLKRKIPKEEVTINNDSSTRTFSRNNSNNASEKVSSSSLLPSNAITTPRGTTIALSTPGADNFFSSSSHNATIQRNNNNNNSSRSSSSDPSNNKNDKPCDAFFSRFVVHSDVRDQQVQIQQQQQQQQKKIDEPGGSNGEFVESLVTVFVEVMTCDEEFQELENKGLYFDLTGEETNSNSSNTNSKGFFSTKSRNETKKKKQPEKIFLEEYQ